jgi:hypothetical protein
MPQRQSYQQRPIRFIERWAPGADWALKVYGINADPRCSKPASVVSPDFLKEAKNVARDLLKKPDFSGEVVHRAGYMILHQGLLGNWLLFDWWSHEVLWNQLLFRSETAVSPHFVPVTSGVVGCTWEVCVMASERDAWVRQVLQASPEVTRSDAIAAYMNVHFNGDV